MDIFIEVMRSHARRLELARDDSAHVAHKGLMGSMRERAFRSLLRKFLPPAYGIVSGEVVNVAGDHSRQQDCLIVDQLTTIPFLIEDDEGVYPIEAIRGCVELKSRYSPSVLRTALDNVASLKRLAAAADDDDWRPFGSIVCYPDGTSPEAIVATYLEECEALPDIECPDALLVVGETFVCHGRIEGGRPGSDGLIEGGSLIPLPPKFSRTPYSVDHEDTLLDWFCVMVDHVQRAPSRTADLYEYVNRSRATMRIRQWERGLE